MSQRPSQKIQFGLRGVGNVELNLASDSKAFVFFGSNGVGKTRCLETLYLLHVAYSEGFSRSASVQVRPREVPIVSVNGRVVLQYTNVPDSTFQCRLDQLTTTPERVSAAPLVYISAGARAYLPDFKSLLNQLKPPLGGFEARQRAFFSEAAQAITDGNLKNFSTVQDPRRWFVHRAQSVNAYQKSSDSRQADLESALSALHEVDSRIDPTGLQIDGDERVFLKIDGSDRELSELSSGFISLVNIIQSVVAAYSASTNEKNLRHVPGIVFIDEIESHLHPQWQSEIVGKLQSLFPNTTFYIATHSPLVLSRLKDGEAYVLQRDADGVVRSHPVESPSKRVLADLLKLGFDVDLNKLKRGDLLSSDQQSAKAALLKLLEADGDAEAQA